GEGWTPALLDALPVAMSAAAIAAVSCVALTKVVVLAEPFHRTVAPLTKFVPVTVRVNAAPPEVVLDGLRLVMAGTGLLTVKASVLGVAPPGEGLTTGT